MTFRKLSIEHDRDAEVEAWIEEETAEQEARFEKIAQQMEDLGPKREQWYQEFFDRIQTIGYNTDGDDKMVIAPEEIPVQPEGRKDRVVWKHGVDSDPAKQRAREEQQS
jgi:hypothetical protein